MTGRAKNPEFLTQVSSIFDRGDHLIVVSPPIQSNPI